MRTFGVEEELLVVDAKTGVPLPIGDHMAAIADENEVGQTQVTCELQREQIESVTDVCTSLTELDAAIRAGRDRVDHLARQLGGRVAAVGTSPCPADTHITPKPRYLEIEKRFAPIGRDQLVCGLHVHVGVASDEEGVDDLRRGDMSRRTARESSLAPA